MSPTFEVELTELARTKLRKLDAPIRDRIVRKLGQAAGNPSRLLEKLSSVESFKLRVGDYRVVVDVDWDRRILFVLTLGHRSVIYGQVAGRTIRPSRARKARRTASASRGRDWTNSEKPHPFE